MPKSKVRKKTENTVGSVSRNPVHIKTGPSGAWYPALILGFLILGLVWIFLFYLVGSTDMSIVQPGGYLHWMAQLNKWNFVIGIGSIVIGLFLSLRWR